MKNEKYKKCFTTTIKLFTFIFCIWKMIYLALKHSPRKSSFAIKFIVKFFLVFQDI